ncbi:MAG: nucleotide exchange factor GrpE [Myxococcota bacterium]|nr:nucleotide exchange factor GrpE [Myxococcota bacterium]
MSGEQDNVVELNPEQVEDAAAEIETAEPTELERAEAEVAELKAKLKSVSAAYLKQQEEMAAFKARMERQRALKEEILKGDIVSKLFEPLENLRRSIDALERAGMDKDLLGGVEATYTSFLTGFKGMGMEQFGAQGQVFDPNLHEALTTMPVQEEALADRVVQVFSVGYKVGTRVIRPARVIVGAYTAPPAPAEDAAGEE